MKQPLVSIIVPIYNTAEYLEECIQSMLSQTYQNIELILVNDGSTDGSGDICKKFEGKQNVHYYEQENRGITAARKRGVDMAHGEWIMFVDSDDYLYHDAVRYLLSLSDNVDIVVSCNRLPEGADDKIETLHHIDYLRKIYAKEITSGPWAKLFKKSLFNDKTFDFPRRIVRWEDLLMNLQIASDNSIDVRITQKMVFYKRDRVASISKSYILSFDLLEEICQIEEKIANRYLHRLDFIQARYNNRLKLFSVEIDANGFQSDPHHPFVINTMRCLDDTGMWRPLDRWLLSISSPWTLKTAWNLQRKWIRLVHLSIKVHGVTRRILRRLRYEYRQRIVKEQYPMLTATSMKEWEAKGAWGFVFTLHHVDEKDPQGVPSNQVYKISPAFLEKIIIKYKKKGFDFVSLDELSDIISCGRKPTHPFIAFTLDDGYVDNYTKALPVFEKHHVPFCIFLATDFADKKALLWWDSIENLVRSYPSITTSDGELFICRSSRQRQKTFNCLKEKILRIDQSNLHEELQNLFGAYQIDWYSPIKEKGLSWKQVIELANHPLCTIGGHSVSHPAFNSLSSDEVRHEVQEGILRIESFICKKVAHFSYPYGSRNIIFDRDYHIIEELSLETAFCAYGGCITQDNRNMTHLPRITLRES